MSIAAGPVGRSAEAAGAASMKGVAGIFAYSKTKGLFAGVSLEGSVLVERKDANEKLYNRRVSAAALLGGSIPAPVEAEPLLRILNSRAFSMHSSANADPVYNEGPVYEDANADVAWNDRQKGQTSRAATWQDDVYDREPTRGVNRSSTSRANPSETFDKFDSRTNEKPKPARPTAPKPVFGKKADQAIAKFTFDGEQDGDLSFRKGDIITILKRTDNETDWWTGKVAGKEGIFPRYVSFSHSLLLSSIQLSKHKIEDQTNIL